MDAVKPLNYAIRLPASHRALRWVYRVIFVAAVSIGVFGWGPALWRRAETVYWEQKCLAFSLPPEHVVLEEKFVNVLHSENCLPLHRFEGVQGQPVHAGNAIIFLHEMRRPDGTRRL